MKYLLAFSCFFFVLAFSVHAQASRDAAVPVAATVTLNPPSVTLNWPNPGNTNIIVRRRNKGQGGTAWQQLINYANTDLNTLTDNNVVGGQTYEYVVQRLDGLVNAYGYAHVAMYAPLVDDRGQILVFVDSTTALGAYDEIQRLYQDLRGDGWAVSESLTGPSSTVGTVKGQIVAAYNASPSTVKAVLLLGEVPVPYSGNFAWDGHTPDHTGAWPADSYYGDINSNLWTDATVNNTQPARDANKNVPGDGKFDQNFLPSAAELQVGRVDFRRVHAEMFGAADHVGLIKRYLDKNHRWRIGQYDVENKALVDDNFGYFGGEAFGANGYRNAYPLVGEQNVVETDFFDGTESQTYLIGYGCGGGNYNGAGGVGSSANFAADSVNIVFSMLFGSYFGDWDFELNPFMPSALASRGGILTCSWAGRPHHFYQALASGETVGYCMRETMNAQLNSGFANATGKGGAHVALLGDPTLRAHVLKPATALSLQVGCQSVGLTWTASADTTVDGYHIYRSPSEHGPFVRMTDQLVTGTSYVDNAPPPGLLFYQVRAVKMISSPGGGFYQNNAIGVTESVTYAPPVWSLSSATTAESAPNAKDGAIDLSVGGSTGPFLYQWSNGATSQDLSGLAGGLYTVTVTDLGNGCTQTLTVLVNTTSKTEETAFFHQFALSPNPSSDRFNLSLRLYRPQEIRMEVQDPSGRKIWTGPTAQTDALDLAIDLADRPSGMYLLIVRVGQRAFARKLALLR